MAIVEKPILTGGAASPGTAIGVVRIIRELRHLEDVQKGDVLVTTMTTPDMVIAMGRAVAIVTDEGGRTCHAAIIARELGIPCVVGTRIATQVLREGTRVYVDGTKGEVFE
jgi:pyruvate, water dikinase